jgi:hypothetical protein
MVVSWLFLLQGAVVEKLGLVVSYETKNLGVLFSHVRGVMEKIDATIIFSLSGKKLKSFF